MYVCLLGYQIIVGLKLPVLTTCLGLHIFNLITTRQWVIYLLSQHQVRKCLVSLNLKRKTGIFMMVCSLFLKDRKWNFIELFLKPTVLSFEIVILGSILQEAHLTAQ